MTTSRTRTPTRKARDQPAGRRTTRANFTKRTVAYRTLKEMFENGELTGMESPSSVYNMHNVFKKYNIDQFRTGYNNFKSDFIRNGSLVHTNFILLFTLQQDLTSIEYR